MKTTCSLSWKFWLASMAISVAMILVQLSLTDASARSTAIPVPSSDPSHTDLSSELQPHPAQLADLLVESVILIESSGNPRAVGSRGERGLMQIMEATWGETTRKLYGKSVSFQKAFDPELNRRVGKAYLAELHEFVRRHRHQWNADERTLLIACYNAGPSRVAKANFDFDRLPSSTQDYVRRVSAMHDFKITELRSGPESDTAPMMLTERAVTVTRDT